MGHLLDNKETYLPFFNYGGAIVLEENQLKLGPDYFFDFETKDLLSATFSTNQDGIVNSFSYANFGLSTSSGFDLVLPIKINGLDDNIQLNITDVDEGVTFTPVNEVNENEYGAVIGTVTPNAPDVFNTVTINKSDGLYKIDNNEIKLKDEYLLNSDGWIDRDPASSFWGFNTETNINNDLYLGVGSNGYSVGSNYDNGLALKPLYQ